MSTSNDNEAARQHLVDLRLQHLESRFPGRLSDDQRAGVRERLEKLAESAEALGKFPLENGHEPASVFHPTGKEQE
jgi:hypothetical protein